MKILCCPYGGRSDGPSLRFAGVFGEWSAAEATENLVFAARIGYDVHNKNRELGQIPNEKTG